MFSSDYLLHAPRRFTQDWKTILGLTLLLSLLYLPGLGSYGLYDPWETHYGEVARNMVETENYIDPWWGSPWDTADVKREKEGFYSKPPLIMWMMAAGMNVAGYNELGVRLFFPPLAILALLSIYLGVSRLYNRRAGFLAAGVTATTPVFAFMSRQAVTDGPMVCVMTIGVMFLLMALFWVPAAARGEGEPGAGAAPDADADRVSALSRGVVLAVVGFAMLFQLWAILAMDRSPDIVRPYPGQGNVFFRLQWFFTEVFAVGRGKGWVVSLLLLPLAGWVLWLIARVQSRRHLYLFVFYLCCGVVVPAKGWVEWAPVGLAILLYCLLAKDWRIWKEVKVPVGLLIVFMTGHPWVVAMLGGHHPGWYDRFWIHDHWNRIFVGVHSTDDGGFEYFIRWIGYGLFPWIGLLPAAIARLAGGLKGAVLTFTPQRRFELFVFLWAFVAYFMFTKSSTKFHHYIFPAIPGLCILLALLIEDVLASDNRALPVLALAGIGVVFWVGQDLYLMPRNYGESTQNLVNLFTYKYDREWAKFTSPEALSKLTGDALTKAETDNAFLAALGGPILWISLVAGLGLLFMALRREWMRHYGTAVLGVAGLWMGWYSLHEYLPRVAVSWSQGGMWDYYYENCEQVPESERAEYERLLLTTASRVPDKLEMFPRAWCREPIVAFRTNWRGECYYSSNTVIPVPETKNLKPFLEEYRADEGRPFFLFTEKPRVKSELEPALPAWLKGKGKEVYNAGNKFVMLRFEEKKPPEPPPSAPPSAPASGATVVSAPPSGAVAGSAPPSGAAPASAAAEGPPASQPAPAFGPAGGSAGEPETLGSPE